MLDPYSYVSPSRVRSFLCPLGKIRRNTFLQYAERLNNAKEVRLVDVTPDPRPDRAMFSPQGFPNGKVIYDLSISPIDDQMCSLYDLEPWRQTLVVLGLTMYRDNVDMDYEKQVKELRKHFPKAICHKVLVFGVPDSTTIEQTKNVIPVLSAKVSNVTSLETVMCDITSDFLAELAVLTISKQLGSLVSPGIKELDTPATVARPGDKPYNVSLRRGMVKHSPSASSVNLSRATSVSKTGSISIGPTERSKSKQRGRQLKYTGSMYLLAGRVPDALKQFSEAASMLKGSYDHLWFASALDSIGVCLVLQSFLEVPVNIPHVAQQVAAQNHSMFDSTAPTPSSMTPSGSVRNSPDPSSTHYLNHSPSPSVSNSASANAGAGASAHTSTNSAAHSSGIGIGTVSQNLLEFLPELTTAVVRYYARSQSSTEESVPQLVFCETMLRFAKLLVATRLGGGWNPAALSSVIRGTSIEKHITNDSTSTSVIAYWCNKVYSTDLSNLPILAQCNIYSGIASAYSAIGLIRKRTFILRELLVNLIPKIIKSRRQRQQFEQEEITPESGFLTLLDGVQEQGILELLDTLCQVFGAGDITAPGCGWIDLKISFLKTCISVCESIPDIEGIIHYTSLLLSTSADVLSKEEQTLHYQNILRSLDTSRQLGRGDISAKYWDPYLVRDIRVSWASSSTTTTPVEQVPAKGDEAGVFLYNPYRKDTESAVDRVLVKDERAEFVIKLQNPFAFEVQIGDLSMIAEGVELEASATNIYLPPSSMYELMLPVVPRSTGQLKVLGCRIQMVGCNAADFYLREKDDVLQVEQKIKEIGVNAGKLIRQQADDYYKYRQLEMKVVSAQPMMALKSMSVNRGWLMLLEGENHEFNLTLSNISDVPVNLVQFKFLDSTNEPLQQAMHSKDLALSEVYECEYFLYNRRALTWVNSNDSSVGPHQIGTFTIRATGKRGMTTATIHIDYSNEDKTSSSVWTRRLSVPISVTVNPSIELGGCDIIPLQACQAFKNNDSNALLAKFMRTLDDSTQLSEYVVFVADMRNSWSQPMSVTVWSKRDGETDDNSNLVEMTETIYPNRIKRFLLPVLWKPLPVEQTDNPIPLRSRKQYVVDSSMSKEQSRFMREAFWNREKLLSMIGGEWTTTSSSDTPQQRSGAVELRGLRLTQKMVNVLRLEQVQLGMKMTGCEHINYLNETTCELPCDDETTVLETTITNKSTEPLSGMIRLIPSVRYEPTVELDEINRKVLYNGVLQQPVFDIPPGESKSVKLGTVFVARGEYEWTSIFETSTHGPHRLQQHGQRYPMYVRVV